MLLRWIIASIHLLALGIGLGAVWVRARRLGKLKDVAELPPVFRADSFWGISALLWISTGLWRAFGGLEKGTDYYLQSHAFHVKMGLLVIVLLLEIWPMMTLVKWRISSGRSQPIELSPTRAMARISYMQAALIVAMVFAATAMARGMM